MCRNDSLVQTWSHHTSYLEVVEVWMIFALRRLLHMELLLDRVQCSNVCSLVSISSSVNDSSLISALSQKKHVTKFLTYFKIFLPSWKVGQNSPFIRKCNYFLKRSYLKEIGIFCYTKGCKRNGLEESSHCEVLKNNKVPSLLMRFVVVLMNVKDRLIQNLL